MCSSEPRYDFESLLVTPESHYWVIIRDLWDVLHEGESASRELL